MPELEAKIIGWRARLLAAMPGQHERVRELEAHLRDHIEIQMRRGVSANDAFDQAVKRIGEPQQVAREFERLEKRWFGLWRPTAVVYGFVAAGFLWGLLPMGLVYTATVRDYVYRQGTPLLIAGSAADKFGSIALLGAGVLAACILVAGWNLQLTEGKKHSRSREIFRLLLLGGLLLPAGKGLEQVWAHSYDLSRAWSWTPWQVGLLSVTIATWLQLAQFQRFTDQRMRAVLALIAVLVLAMGWLAMLVGRHPWRAPLQIGLVPNATIFVTVAVCQTAIWFLHSRTQREPTDLAPA